MIADSGSAHALARITDSKCTVDKFQIPSGLVRNSLFLPVSIVGQQDMI